MYFSRAFIVSALLGLGAATTLAGEATKTKVPASEKTKATSAAAAAAASSTGSAAAGNVATHVIQVGGTNGSLVFSPDNLKAAVGDLVQFQFTPKNHSVVQSTFDQPCVPIQNVMTNMTNAFFSGYMPTNASIGSTKNVLTYTIRVMDTKPVWFYCSQAKHCQGGMVGAINAAATGNKTMTAFKALAAKAPQNITPGQSAAAGAGAASPSGSGSGSGAGAGTGAGAAGASSAAAGGAAATSSSANSPAQQTTNAAPGLKDAAKQSMFGLSVGALAAFLML